MTAIAPVRSVGLPSRAEISALADRFVAASAHDDLLPPWDRNGDTVSKAWYALQTSGIYAATFPALESLNSGNNVPPVVAAYIARDHFETRRDVLLTVCAIESYHRKHGSYPDSLAALTPGLLPSVPLDPFDGKPLRYLAAGHVKGHEGAPVIYSIGMDEKDDGGTPPAEKRGNWLAGSWSPRTYAIALLKPPSGDWVLWPRPKEDD